MSPPAPPRHILAGDDSPMILELFREILEEEGYRVSVSRHALDLAEVKRIGPDLVILNHMLTDGEGSGWQLLRELRADPDTTDLPVVVCTGAVQKVRAEEEFLGAVGANVVIKPFNINELVRAVDTAWSRRSVGTAGLEMTAS